MRGVRAAIAACAWRPIAISSGTEMSTSAAAAAAGRSAIAALSDQRATVPRRHEPRGGVAGAASSRPRSRRLYAAVNSTPYSRITDEM